MDANADLTPPGLARLLRDFLNAVGAERVTLVGNDTGGAICQVFPVRYPERVSRLVLTNCDAFEGFLPPSLRPLQYGARVPGFTAVLLRSLRIGLVSQLVFASVAKTPIPRAGREAYLRGVIGDASVRRDFQAVLRGISSRYTIEAAREFPEFERPVLLVWAEDDFFFPMSSAERLAGAFPGARLERVADSRAFVPIDRLRRLAESIAAFVAGTGRNGSDGGDRVLGDGTRTAT